MFCLKCGAENVDGAKFCNKCGAKIISEEEGILPYNSLREEYQQQIEEGLFERYINDDKLDAQEFYKRARFYEMQKEQVDKIVVEYKEKIEKINAFIQSILEETIAYELAEKIEDEEDEIIRYGNALGFADEDIEGIIEKYKSVNYLEEKSKLYSDYIGEYLESEHVEVKRREEELEPYQEEVYDLFKKNISKMEDILKEQYAKAKDYDLSEEQVHAIYLEGEKLFPYNSLHVIIYAYEKKNGIIEYKNEIERKRAEEKATKFELYGKCVKFYEEDCIGINLGKQYRRVFKRLMNELSMFYKREDIRKDGYWEDLNRKVITLIKVIYDSMVSTLRDIGITEKEISAIDYKELFVYWIPIFEKIDDKYNEICFGTEAAEFYRKLRKESRGRFVGGGFGIEGALKGMVTAQALNLASGAAHSAFNLMGDVKDNWRLLQQKKELFGNPLKETIVKVFRDTIQLAYDRHIEILEESYEKRIKRYQLFYASGQMKGEAFHVAELEQDPFNENVYEKTLRIMGDEKKELERIADFTDINVLELKEKYLNESCKAIRIDKVDPSILRSRIQSMKKRQGYTKTLAIETNIEKKIKEIEKAKRTVYDLEIEGVFGKDIKRPELRGGKEWVFDDVNDKKLQEMIAKREEFVLVYENMQVKDLKNVRATLEKLEIISAQYGIGENIVKKLKEYLISQIAPDDKIKYPSYSTYKEIREFVRDGKWGKELLADIYARINWKTVFKSHPEVMDEDFVYLMEDDKLLDVPELIPFVNERGECVIEETASRKLDTAEMAYAMRKSNEAVRIIWNTIDFQDEDDMHLKRKKITERNKDAAYEKIIDELSQKIVALEESNNKKYGKSYREEKHLIESIEKTDWRGIGCGRIVDSLKVAKDILKLEKGREANLTSKYAKEWLAQKENNILAEYNALRERLNEKDADGVSIIFINVMLFGLAIIIGIILFFATGIIGKIVAVLIVIWRCGCLNEKISCHRIFLERKKGYQDELENFDSLVKIADNKVYVKFRFRTETQDVSMEKAKMEEGNSDLGSKDQKKVSEEKDTYMFCTHCGKRILRTTKFCNFCGEKNTYDQGGVKTNEM